MALPGWLPETFEEEGNRCIRLSEHFRNKCPLEPKTDDERNIRDLFHCAANNETEKGEFLLFASKSKDEEVWKKACQVLTDGVSALRPLTTGAANSGIPRHA